MDENSIREIPFSSETIYDGKILHVERWQVTCPNGKAATREIVVHKGAAAIVPGAMDWIGLVLICFVLPAVLCPLLNGVCRKLGWVKDGDLTLS